MNLDPVITRLRAASVPEVRGMGSLAAIRQNPPQMLPATFVAPDREAAQPARDLAGIHDQVVTCDFIVAVMIGTDGVDPDGADQELKAVAGLVEDVVTGWVHPDAEGASTDYLGASLLSLENARVTWVMRFRTYRRIRRQPMTT